MFWVPFSLQGNLGESIWIPAITQSKLESACRKQTHLHKTAWHWPFSHWEYECACGLSRLSCVWFFATLWTVARQAPLSCGLLRARILEWVAMPSSRVSPQPRDQSHVSCLLHWQMGSLSLAPPGFKYLSPLPSLNRLNTSEVLWNVSMRMHSKQEICLVWCILELHWGWPSLNSALADLNMWDVNL